MSAMPPNAEPKEKPGSSISRAGFLSFVGKSLLTMCGLLGLGGLVEFLSFQPDPAPPTQFDLGAASNYPPGSHTMIPEARAVLMHDGSGFMALSLLCPHLGCTLGQTPDGYACPCHGSRFTPDGSLRNGPANQPMRGLKVEETSDGRLILHTGL
jgi:cytochrome b6-f complex iron-sulfur subunit